MKGFSTYLLIFLFISVSGGLVLFGYRSLYELPPCKVAEVKQVPKGPQHFELKEGQRKVPFDLLDPELAPDDIKEMVMLGYQICLDTPKYAAEYSGNTLSCNHCHFDAGNTFGGKNGGLSLVGVSNKYPTYSKRAGREINLRERLNNCFRRSLNGKALPLDCKEMDAMIAYLDWISSPVKDVEDIPWIGLDLLKSAHKPDPKNGALVYEANCASCHLSTGEGAEGIPPLWGDNSFNDGAGMNTIKRFSAFVYLNMPYQQPGLSAEEALDVAAYVTKQPRPHFSR